MTRFTHRDCDGFNGKSRAVKGNDSVLDHSLMDLPFCKSFLNVPEPNVKLSLCKVSGRGGDVRVVSY